MITYLQVELAFNKADLLDRKNMKGKIIGFFCWWRLGQWDNKSLSHIEFTAQKNWIIFFILFRPCPEKFKILTNVHKRNLNHDFFFHFFLHRKYFKIIQKLKGENISRKSKIWFYMKHSSVYFDEWYNTLWNISNTVN